VITEARQLLKGVKFPILDHGHVVLMDFMGSDADIVQAARTSYQAGTKHTSDERTLLRYLMRHRHSSPFESAIIKLHIKLPIVVERQWARTRTAGWNEVSGRYSELPEECYLPVEEDVCYQSAMNRQGREGQVTPETYAEYRHGQQDVQKLAFRNYKNDLEAGIARETARNSLPLSTYTEKVWWINLHNMFHFLGLRMESHAQKEIRDYATVIGESIVSVLFPESWAAFVDYRLNAMSLHGREIELIAKLLASLGKLPNKQNITDWMPYLPDDWKTIRCRERDEFFAKLQRLGL
jgi:thymidylate synthase (FAD)